MATPNLPPPCQGGLLFDNPIPTWMLIPRGGRPTLGTEVVVAEASVISLEIASFCTSSALSSSSWIVFCDACYELVLILDDTFTAISRSGTSSGCWLDPLVGVLVFCNLDPGHLLFLFSVLYKSWQHDWHEREHRQRARTHELLITPMPHKCPRLAFKAARTPHDKPKLKEKPMPESLEHQDACSTDPSPDMPPLDVEILGPLTSNNESDHHPEGSGQEHDTDQLLVATMSQRWHQDHGRSHPQPGPDEDSDSGKASNVPLEDGLDSDDSDVIDRDTLDRGCGFTIRDELGEDFESSLSLSTDKTHGIFH
ncbi:hypothetical protein BJY52DRAFT_1227825 [Lactarius psammicola]|nr:hypothetical protein BJY52DRAFT_1227825 [Lactarius psammicola]